MDTMRVKVGMRFKNTLLSHLGDKAILEITAIDKMKLLEDNSGLGVFYEYKGLEEDDFHINYMRGKISIRYSDFIRNMGKKYEKI